MARQRSISEQIRVAKQATKEATQRVFVETARREHARVMGTDPKPAVFAQFVDGVAGAPLENVRPNGVIVFRYPRLQMVAQFAMETLFDLSPVLSGAYRLGHRLFLNGKEVSNLAAYKSGDDVAITNYLPYARKIEVGKMKMRVSGSDRVYQQARRKVMARFGNVAAIQFTYRGIVGGTQINAERLPSALKRSRDKRGRFLPSAGGASAHNRRDLRFPVLLIKEL